MNLSGSRVLVTGGAGHVGSRLAQLLTAECDVVVADDLSTGTRERIPEEATFHEVDLADPDNARDVIEDIDLIFHLAVARKDVQGGARQQFDANVGLTFSVIEAAIEAEVEGIAFTSSSTVYGEDVPLPTPESHGPMAPISAYGAAKLAEEGLLSTMVETAGIHVWIARLANVVGPVFDGTVIPDFVEKLTADPTRLEILGNGYQEKSFIHVDDTAQALIDIVESGETPFGVYNVGTDDAISIREVARIVADVGEVDPEFTYTGGDRGWTGDVPRMCLDIERLRGLGWEPRDDCAEAVERAATQLAQQASLIG